MDFLLAKKKKAQRITRELYILKEIYYDDLINSICTYLPKYQESLRNLRIDGYEIMVMLENHPQTSEINDIKSERTLFCNKIFVSPCSWASSPLASRDLQDSSQVIMDELSVDGNTQDLLNYLKSAHHDICLVIIDFRGLTTRSEDIVDLVEANPLLKKIAVDTFARSDDVFIFDTEKLVEDSDLLQKFD
ncbi:hypothetical protein BDC45DRAFT_537088 [Circinella umbellata]|nr:hypothetical protein BDC45DRAFT_537088 [Circinella umbellata]